MSSNQQHPQEVVTHQPVQNLTPEEMEQLALTAPDGAVFDACEEAVVEKGRKLQGQVLGEAVARRIETAEKRGRRSASVRADARKKTVGRKSAN